MRILLAEDDEQLNKNLVFGLKARGFTVDACFDGEDACFYGEQNIYDLILLDRMLPHMEGTEVLTRLRKKKITTPVILLTALGTLSDKVTGLDLGADDYLVKPFEFEELLARIRCISRRSQNLNDSESLSVSDITWYHLEDQLCGPTGSCTLSKREAALMETFLRRKDQTLSRSMLLLKVWGLTVMLKRATLTIIFILSDEDLKQWEAAYRLRLSGVSDIVCRIRIIIKIDLNMYYRVWNKECYV